MPFRDVFSPVDQRKTSNQALCFSATEEASFQMVGWKLVHMIITLYFFCFLVVFFTWYKEFMTLHIHVIFHNPHSAHLTPRTPLSWMLAVLPRALGSQQQACLVVETPIHPQGLTAADIPVSWPWACVPAMTMCEGKLVKKCSCTGVCSAALLKGCSGARSCLWVVEHTNMLLLICFFPNNCISVEIMWSKLRKWQDAYPD